MTREAEGTCAYHEQLADDLKEIKADTKAIRGRLAAGDVTNAVTFATFQLRLSRLETIIYGACGTSLLALLAAILALVFKK